MNEIKQPSQLVNEAKDAFENQIETLKDFQTLSSSSKSSIRHSLSKTPNWNKAFIKKIRSGNAIIVPIEYEKELYLKVGKDKKLVSLKNLSYLIIYNDKYKNKNIEWVTAIPDENDYDPLKKFVGKVIIENWNGTFKKGYQYNMNGQISNLSLLNNENVNTTNQDKTIKTNSVVCITYPWYSYAYVVGHENDGYTSLGGYDTFCFGSENDQEPNQNGGSNQAGPGCSSCFGEVIYPTEYVPVIIYSDIINNLNNTDANCIFQRLKDNALFRQLLANFQDNKNLNVTFQMGSPVDLNGNPVAGQTSHILGTTNFTITIDNNYFAQYGGIEVATTFLHEAFHANLYTQAQLWYPSDLPSNFQNWSLVDQIKYIDNRSGSVAGFSNSYQHNYIASHIDDIATAIQAYTQVSYPSIYNNPNATFDSYRAMAYGGLNGTQCYNTYVNSLSNGQASFTLAYTQLISVLGENKCP